MKITCYPLKPKVFCRQTRLTERAQCLIDAEKRPGRIVLIIGLKDVHA